MEGCAEWKSSSSLSVIKARRGLFFPANYVEMTETIKHLVVILPAAPSLAALTA